jgi:geranylgeranyl diphosphate synthase, type II
MTTPDEIPPVLLRWKGPVELCLGRLLPPDDETSGLAAAMRYSLLAGGKRIRPVLALAAYDACGGEDPTLALEPACALEMFHTYSLIHDDLPAMDDDDLRRGRPTNHKVFGEAVAILAGDALQTLGAEVLSRFPEGDSWAVRRGRVSLIVFRALGWDGMAGGQALDLSAEGRTGLALEDLLAIHRRKTGALLVASLLTGAVLAGADRAAEEALTAYGENLGLAFQVVDDILDVTASTQDLGKTAGKDPEQGKATFPALWGLDGARREADRLLAASLEALQPFGNLGGDLARLAEYVVSRDR